MISARVQGVETDRERDEAQFIAATWAGIREAAKLSPPYHPTRYIQKIHECEAQSPGHGELLAAQWVLREPVKDGFTTLLLAGHVELSTESTATQFPSLFTNEELGEAHRRLPRR